MLIIILFRTGICVNRYKRCSPLREKWVNTPGSRALGALLEVHQGCAGEVVDNLCVRLYISRRKITKKYGKHQESPGFLHDKVYGWD